MALGIKWKLHYWVILNVCLVTAQKGYGFISQTSNPSTAPALPSLLSVARSAHRGLQSNVHQGSSAYGSSLVGETTGYTSPVVAKLAPSNFWASYLEGSRSYSPNAVKPSTSCSDCGSVQASSVFPPYLGSQTRQRSGQSVARQDTATQRSSGPLQGLGVSSSVQNTVPGYGSGSQVITGSTGRYSPAVGHRSPSGYGSQSVWTPVTVQSRKSPHRIPGSVFPVLWK
ncbi:hypothetical protein AGIG_G24030 [Arapaima gigas]